MEIHLNQEKHYKSISDDINLYKIFTSFFALVIDLLKRNQADSIKYFLTIK